jgi:hypothetical protein
MANIQTSTETTNQIDETPAQERRSEVVEAEEEFQITVKKLDVVVKPRGVLAD